MRGPWQQNSKSGFSARGLVTALLFVAVGVVLGASVTAILLNRDAAGPDAMQPSTETTRPAQPSPASSLVAAEVEAAKRNAELARAEAEAAFSGRRPEMNQNYQLGTEAYRDAQLLLKSGQFALAEDRFGLARDYFDGARPAPSEADREAGSSLVFPAPPDSDDSWLNGISISEARPEDDRPPRPTSGTPGN